MSAQQWLPVVVEIEEVHADRDRAALHVAKTRRAEKPRIPFHMDLTREFFGAEGREDFPGLRFQSGIASKNHRRKRRRKNEVELLEGWRFIQLQGAAI